MLIALLSITEAYVFIRQHDIFSYQTFLSLITENDTMLTCTNIVNEIISMTGQPRSHINMHIGYGYHYYVPICL